MKAGAMVRFAVYGIAVGLFTFTFLWSQDGVQGEGTATEQWVARYDGPAGGSDQARWCARPRLLALGSNRSDQSGRRNRQQKQSAP